MNFRRKMNSLVPILGTVHLLLIITLTSFSQPAYLEPINPFETCHQAYRNHEYVFIGRIRSLDRNVYSDMLGGDRFAGLSVSIEHQIKGEVDLPIVIYKVFARLPDIPSVGKTYIFLANKRNLDSQGEILFSRIWSYELQDIPKEDLDRIVREMIEISRGIKQPQIVGKLIRQNYPFRQYRNMRSQKVMRLGYDPDYAEPIGNTEVSVISENGKAFSTTSASDGSFFFNNLPFGKYRVVPKLEGNHRILLDDWKVSPDPNVGVYDRVCSANARIRVIPLGGIVGRIKSFKKWEKLPSVSLIPSDPVTNTITWTGYDHKVADVKLDASGQILTFSDSDVPVGKYVVQVSIDYQHADYFPNLRDQTIPEKTVLIEQGKILEFVYPEPPRR